MSDAPHTPDDAALAERLRRRAVAVRYDHEQEGAPRVVGKGRGLIAERIIEMARAEGITIYEDPDLVTLLAALDVHAQIPPDLYKVVAEVLAFVYRMNKMPLYRALEDARPQPNR